MTLPGSQGDDHSEYLEYLDWLKTQDSRNEPVRSKSLYRKLRRQRRWKQFKSAAKRIVVTAICVIAIGVILVIVLVFRSS
jgi:hypothetical protein